MKDTKINLVAKHLISKRKITSWEAIERYHATRLADIIYVLKSEGWDIITEMVKQDGVRFAVYRYISAPRKGRLAA
jgi:Helix-turn-helix domain